MSETSDLQDLQTIPIFAVLLGPANFSIWISISMGIWSNSPKDDDPSNRRRSLGDISKCNPERVDTDSHTFLSNIAMGKSKRKKNRFEVYAAAKANEEERSQISQIIILYSTEISSYSTKQSRTKMELWVLEEQLGFEWILIIYRPPMTDGLRDWRGQSCRSTRVPKGHHQMRNLWFGGGHRNAVRRILQFPSLWEEFGMEWCVIRKIQESVQR